MRKVTDGVRKTRGVWGVVPPQTRYQAQPNLSASAVRSQPAQAQYRANANHCFYAPYQLEEIPECDYFLTTLARGENISFEDDGLRGGGDGAKTILRVQPPPPPPTTPHQPQPATAPPNIVPRLPRIPIAALPPHISPRLFRSLISPRGRSRRRNRRR